MRGQSLQRFVEAAGHAFDRYAQSERSRTSVAQCFDRLRTIEAPGNAPARRLPVCAHLPAALSVDTPSPELSALIEAFRKLEPQIRWSTRADTHRTGSENFADGHANAMIFGPGGVEEREDVWLGASLLAPRVRYPIHDHPPEETYLVLSEGEFQQAGGAWFSPGIGGSFFNVPMIEHAMRSGDTPLFAFWALLA